MLLMPPRPPHEMEKERIVKAIFLATCIAGGFGLMLVLLQFPLNVVIPSSAPVWAGLSSVLK